MALDSGRLGRTRYKPARARAVPWWGESSNQVRYHWPTCCDLIGRPVHMTVIL